MRAQIEGNEVLQKTAPCRAVWIASYPKSGNTWVRVFLHNLIRELRGENDGTQSINALHELTARESLANSFSRYLKKSAFEASPQEIAEARVKVQADMVHGEGGPVYIKTHNAVAVVEGFLTINFDVTLAAIYIVRNPLDVAVSYAHFTGLSFDPIIAYMANPSGNIDNSDRRVYEFMGSWSFHAKNSFMVSTNAPRRLRNSSAKEKPDNGGKLCHKSKCKPSLRPMGR